MYPRVTWSSYLGYVLPWKCGFWLINIKSHFSATVLVICWSHMKTIIVFEEMDFNLSNIKLIPNIYSVWENTYDWTVPLLTMPWSQSPRRQNFLSYLHHLALTNSTLPLRKGPHNNQAEEAHSPSRSKCVATPWVLCPWARAQGDGFQRRQYDLTYEISVFEYSVLNQMFLVKGEYVINNHWMSPGMMLTIYFVQVVRSCLKVTLG